jgi:hypothetical protein
MVLKHFFTAVICTMLLAWSGPSIADQYRPGDFFGLDLSKAVLSPKPLGPPTQFAPFPVEAGTDSEAHVPQTRAETKAAPDVHVAKVGPAHLGARHLGIKRPEHAARTRLAHRRHGNPLDAQAFDRRIFDRRIQVWPCRSGGICNWSRPAPGG